MGKMKDIFTTIQEMKSMAAQGICPMCMKKTNHKPFRDTTSKREAKISGLCQDCQDKVFGVDLNEMAEAGIPEGCRTCFDLVNCTDERRQYCTCAQGRSLRPQCEGCTEPCGPGEDDDVE